MSNLEASCHAIRMAMTALGGRKDRLPNCVVARSRSSMVLASVVFAAGMAFVAGCAGTPQFSAMPPPGQLGEQQGYTTILGPVSGSGSRTFTISARPGIGVWIGCIGKGAVWMTRPVAVGGNCGTNSGNSYSGGVTDPTHFRRGQVIVVRIVGPASARWEFRVDGAPWRADGSAADHQG
jgi:hypothetical protein